MTIALEDVKAGDWEAVRRAVDTLRSLVPDMGGASLSVRIGVATLTWPGGSQSTSGAVVQHGLGKTPVVVLATVLNPPVDAWSWVQTLTSTAFTVVGRTSSAAPAGGTTATVSWLAIG